jgi:hypothetical protein
MKTARNLLARAFQKAAHLVDPSGGFIDITDDYVRLLCFENAGLLDRGNLYSFDYAIRHLSSTAPILEIGSFCGLSTNVLTHYKRKHGAKNLTITCDKWESEKGGIEPWKGSPITWADWDRFGRDSYIRNIQMFSPDDLPFTFEMTSDEFFAAWRDGCSAQDVLGRTLPLGGPLSFCYVDGNHTYEYAKRDFVNCDAFLEVGGFILFDDSINTQFDVYRVIPEVLACGRYKLVAKNPNHLFQKVRASTA